MSLCQLSSEQLLLEQTVNRAACVRRLLSSQKKPAAKQHEKTGPTWTGRTKGFKTSRCFFPRSQGSNDGHYMVWHGISTRYAWHLQNTMPCTSRNAWSPCHYPPIPTSSASWKLCLGNSKGVNCDSTTLTPMMIMVRWNKTLGFIAYSFPLSPDFAEEG